MNASHVATGTITALIAQVLVYITTWPLHALDTATAMAIAGLLVAAAGAAVKVYQAMAPKRPMAQLVKGPGAV
jgi:hypothetical protein